jgi:serine protease AprX
MWQKGWTGKGVDVALIDSGVAPVEGLAMNVINGPDLSFESQASNLTDIDTYGHGTHLAGLIAGRDSSIRPGREDEDVDNAFVGAAPGARIVSVKVAASDGATDVSQVIAAIDWVVEHRNTEGLNIRVLNLSFGTDSTQDYRLDPLAYAAEVAWFHGIVVVVSAGNAGLSTTRLNDPAYDPYVIAVGADDTKGTDDAKDDTIPSWESRGNSERSPDVVAPGKSIVSLRDPGSFVDTQNPTARLGGSRFFKGSGSSQAAAIVSGACGDPPSAASRSDPGSGQVPPPERRFAPPRCGCGRPGRGLDQSAQRARGEDSVGDGRRAELAALDRSGFAAAGARHGRGQR